MNDLDCWLRENKTQFLQDLSELIKISSIAETEIKGSISPFGAGCRRALDKVLCYAQRDGMEGRDHYGYCGSVLIGDAPVELGIWNHLDVVPAGEGWVYPPFECSRINGLLIGRGIVDNKGPAMVVHYAMKYLQENKLLHNIRIRHIMGCQEESGMNDVKWYLQHQKLSDYSFVADCGFPVCCGEKGICRIQFESKKKIHDFLSLEAGTVSNSIPTKAAARFYTVDGTIVSLEEQGIGGHAAFPEGTSSAVGKLGRHILEYSVSEEIRKAVTFIYAAGADGYGEHLGISNEDKISGKLTCNLGLVQFLQGKVILSFDIRYPVSVKSGSFLSKIEKEAEKAGFKMIGRSDNEPYYVEKETPFVQVLMEAYKNETGIEQEPYVMGGGTYARIIPNAVSFGPAQDVDFKCLNLPSGHGFAHYADEADSEENLLRAIRIYINTILRLDKWVESGK